MLTNEYWWAGPSQWLGGLGPTTRNISVSPWWIDANIIMLCMSRPPARKIALILLRKRIAECTKFGQRCLRFVIPITVSRGADRPSAYPSTPLYVVFELQNYDNNKTDWLIEVANLVREVSLGKQNRLHLTSGFLVDSNRLELTRFQV